MGICENEQLASATADANNARDKALRELAAKKFYLQRLEIASGDGKAAAAAAKGLHALWGDGGGLESLVRVAFTANYEALGREFFQTLQDVMTTDAGIAAARELNYGFCSADGAESLDRTIEGLEKTW